jgi:hypothetical protein
MSDRGAAARAPMKRAAGVASDGPVCRSLGACAPPAQGEAQAQAQRRLSDPGEVVDGLPDDEVDEESSVSVPVLLPEVDG